jgi:signal transduction histidine kinase
MNTIYKQELRCFVIIPNKDSRPLLEAIKSLSKETGIKIITHDKVESEMLFPMTELISSEIARSDLVIVDLSPSNENVYYEIGLAHAMGKFVVFLVNAVFDSGDKIFNRQGSLVFQYTLTPKGIEQIKGHLTRFFEDFKQAPRRFRPFLPNTFKLAQPSLIIDFEKIGLREFENLCYELIAQMGYRRVEWGKEFREIDLFATLQKKDPDGFEYQELWLISFGRRIPVEIMLEMAINDPRQLLQNMVRSPDMLEELLYKYRIRFDVPITILFVMRGDGPSSEVIEQDIRKMERRYKEKVYPFSFRIRWWDQNLLSNLIQQYPQLAYKYFSEEARIKTKYRKTPEEMYQDNILLNERLQSVNLALTEEKKKRFIAERDAAWKDVAFKAAHKLGNPIDAIDTFLESLRIRLDKKLIPEAIKITSAMEVSIEESKVVISQFKSLTKAQEINPKPLNIIPVIEHATRIAEETKVKISINAIENCPLLIADCDRMADCFNELVANSLHWFDKVEKNITVKIERVAKKELPDALDKTLGFLKITFSDNGVGIPIENKEKIFSPFFTTYAHGTGLGLALVRTIIEGHGGLILEKGKPGDGAVFEIYLPIYKKNRRN